MNKILLVGILLLSVSVFSQESAEIVPIVLDGKPAYMNMTTGAVVSKDGKAINGDAPVVESKAKTKVAPVTATPVSTAYEAPTDEVADPSAVSIHKVKRGETLSGIAHKYGMKISDLKRLNSLSSDRINADKKLKVIMVPESDRPKIHKVVAGDNLIKLSKQYQISTTKIKELNDLTSDVIKIGQKLIVN